MPDIARKEVLYFCRIEDEEGFSEKECYYYASGNEWGDCKHRCPDTGYCHAKRPDCCNRAVNAHDDLVSMLEHVLECLDEHCAKKCPMACLLGSKGAYGMIKATLKKAKEGKWA